MWASKNPDVFVTKGPHPEKIGVWCAILKKRVIGPFFFWETPNAECYQSIIEEFPA